MARSPSAGVGFVRAASALLSLAIFAPAAPAGVVSLDSQTRFVDVTTSGVPQAGLPVADKRIDAPDFGPFNQSVSLNFPFITQTASQNSTLTLTPDGMGAAIDATGSLSGEISLNGLNATNHFQVDFTLTQPEPYLLTYNGEVGDPRPTSPKVFVPGFFLGPSAPGTLAGDPHITEFFTVLTYSGTLQPGSYELRTEIHAIGFGSFDTHLAIGAAAVPLPPALWQMLVWLPVLLFCLWLFSARPKRPGSSRASSAPVPPGRRPDNR
ncbi:MAG TPA: hypothetical protein VK797_11755 [Tepidisphaeraceae bacterium]|nr:hypothetical protein [Tepidisphaeraceae bacterium]